MHMLMQVYVCIYSFESLEFHLSLLSSASLHSCTYILLPIFMLQMQTNQNNLIFDFSYRFARIFNGALKPYEISIRYALHFHLPCIRRCIQIQRECQMWAKHIILPKKNWEGESNAYEKKIDSSTAIIWCMIFSVCHFCSFSTPNQVIFGWAS